MRVAVLYSGGKDSNLAAWRVKSEGHELACLISASPLRSDSYMFHVPNVALARHQAECIGVPWVEVKVSGIKELEVSELAEALPGIAESLRIDAIVTGAIASRYQKERVDQACKKAGLLHLHPLWQQDGEALIREMIGLGFETYFTSVSAEGLGPEWLGRRLDLDALGDLLRLNSKHGINVSGEGGEYETFVCDMPLFRNRIKITSADKSWERTSGHLEITGIKLVKKR
ncbi:MAG: diphthine--ammonia ligase [Candidatus Methanosuratincola sp.]|jgi:ABC transporter with metal-binding/Fe-S-binding domain ATP-binding protein|nr:diphthine--ammonia ligase [Candidatus Methanosuratincola sp.]